MRKRLALLAAAALLGGGLAAAATTSPAWACSNGTGGYSGQCAGSSAVQFQGTINIPSSISFTTDVQSFVFDTVADGPGVLADRYRVDVASNDSSGVGMWIAGPPGGTFSCTAANCSTVIPDTFVSVSTVGSIAGTANGPSGVCAAAQETGGSAQSLHALQVGGTQFQTLDDQNPVTGHLTCQPNTAAGWDSFGFQGVELNSVPAGLSAGQFSGALTLSEWGD